MVHSMTGFSAKTLVIFPDKDHQVNLSISIKSLNSRFFETTCKMPFAFSNFETDFVKMLKAKLHRGHIYFTVHASSQHLVSCTIQPAFDIIRGYLEAVQAIKKEFNLNGELTIHELMRLPNTFNVEEKEIDDERSKKMIFDAVEQLINEVIEARKKEGALLKKDLEQRMTNVQLEIHAIEQAYNTLMEQQKALISQELGGLDTLSDEVAEPRRQVLYATLDKIDIHEEIVRFKSHLGNFVMNLASQTIEKGKRLDFILQELAREVNTIAAKCSDSTIGSFAINIKVDLEKAREQVQNIV
jgi:uncharacterized protein (TIGR00255 family)